MEVELLWVHPNWIITFTILSKNWGSIATLQVVSVEAFGCAMALLLQSGTSTRKAVVIGISDWTYLSSLFISDLF